MEPPDPTVGKMIIICGLGNPGREYEQTRHNMGFLTLDLLSENLGIPIKKIKHKALLGEGYLDGEKVILVKPQTYMNLSGESLRPLMEYYKAEPADLLVVYDDIDLPVGEIRIRRSGSAGTHNGMRSVIYQLGRDDFARIRIGIGGSGCIPLEKYVLMTWPPQEKPLLAQAVERAARACETFARSGIDEAMRQWSGNAAEPRDSREKAAPEE